jgi:hypothetical protein
LNANSTNRIKQKQQPRNAGHELNDIARFMDSTRHMIIFEVLIENYPVAEKGEKVRLYLSETGYQNALQSQKRGEIKIVRHARVRKGELLHD